MSKYVADAIDRNLTSQNVCDSNFEAANIVDVIQHIANAGGMISRAITASAAPGNDVHGGCVASLTESVMGVTKSLSDIAQAINRLADVYEAK